MDFRQYDAAIGRFYNMDPLAEHEYGWTAYHFSLNNPIYFSDPSGLKQAPGPQYNAFPTWANTIWEKSNDGDLWINGGGGTLYNTSTGNEVDLLTGEYIEYPVLLPEITLPPGKKDRYGNYSKENSILVQQHVFNNSPYYKFYRDQNSTRQLDSFQETLSDLGNAPVVGEIFDGANAVISIFRGNYGEAALSMAAMIPVIGNGAYILKKTQIHHIIPKAVYRDAGDAIKKAMKLNEVENLVKIPSPFHGNHPQYNIFVKDELRKIQELGEGVGAGVLNLQKDLRSLIDDAYSNYLVTGDNLNEYFRLINNTK